MDFSSAFSLLSMLTPRWMNDLKLSNHLTSWFWYDWTYDAQLWTCGHLVYESQILISTGLSSVPKVVLSKWYISPASMAQLCCRTTGNCTVILPKSLGICPKWHGFFLHNLHLSYYWVCHVLCFKMQGCWYFSQDMLQNPFLLFTSFNISNISYHPVNRIKHYFSIWNILSPEPQETFQMYFYLFIFPIGYTRYYLSFTL